MTPNGLRKTKIRRLEGLTEQVAATVTEDDEDGACILKQHSEQIADAKSKLKDIRFCTRDMSAGRRKSYYTYSG